MNSRIRSALPLLGALLLLLLPFREFFGPAVPSGRDRLFYFFPLKAHLVEAVSRGEMPWVDRYRWGGAPLLGAPSAAPFDPANVLFLVLPLGAAMKTWIVLHLAAALAGFAAFAKRLGLSPGAAAVAGLVFALGGTAVSIAPFPPTLSALSILPWFAAFVSDLARRPRMREAAMVAAAAALILVAMAPEFVLYATFVAVAVFFVARDGGGSLREAARPIALLAASALVGASLAAVAVLPAAASAARSVRLPEGGGTLGSGGSRPFAAARLAELVADGIVADWTVVAQAPGIKDYPYFPSVTPGRVAWILVLLGLVRRGPGRIAAGVLAVFGLLLALGDSTPVFGLLKRVLPLLGWIRYPERHLILTGFGLAWLAALGILNLSRVVSPRLLRFVLPLLALAVLLDRERVARRLSPTEDASVLTRRPALLADLPEPLPGSPPPRLFYQDLYLPVPRYDVRDLASNNRLALETLLPAYASLFGVGYQFEVDYDLSLAAEAFEWTEMLHQAVPRTPGLALRFIRGAGVAAIAKSVREPDGRFRSHLARLGDAVPPYRFASRIVASTDARAVFGRLLEEGFPVDTAYVDGALPGVSASPPMGRILSVSDRPSALALEVEVEGPGAGFLMLYRLREAAEDATVDGRTVSVSRLAFGFAGVEVPPGRHALRLRPDTRWVKIGFVISVLAALGLAGTLLYAGGGRATTGA